MKKIKQKIAKWLMPELFESKEELLKQNRRIIENSMKVEKDIAEYKLRAFDAEQAFCEVGIAIRNIATKYNEKDTCYLRTY